MENVLQIDICSTEIVKKYRYSTEISNQGYSFIDSNTFQKIQEEHKFFNVCEQDATEFIDSWNNLNMDQFMSDKGKYRTRKHATFVINNIALINRQNIQGGMTRIYNLNKILETEFMLENFLDIALVDDHKVYHSVTETKVDNAEKDHVGLRDVLVITFKKA